VSVRSAGAVFVLRMRYGSIPNCLAAAAVALRRKIDCLTSSSLLPTMVRLLSAYRGHMSSREGRGIATNGDDRVMSVLQGASKKEF
jgi:hypothetical protein